MPGRRHIDDILAHWPYEPNSLTVRVIAGRDGREVIQMRIDMGVLQLEMDGRPDGTRPHGAETYYDFLLGFALHEGDDFELTEEQCNEIDREFIQYYHRRICWLKLQEYERAVQDADHTLGLMDFCGRHSPDQRWTLSHEQYRPFVLFHRTQAAALAQLSLETAGGDGRRNRAEAAMNEISQGLERLRQLFADSDAEDQFDEDELVMRLMDLRESLREQYQVGRTLREQLADAVAAEQYELAALLRDKLSSRDGRY